tara:strand:- start:612 stop:1547 length:936 start_codon:yes stop_codon:yes gene_type:complete
VLTSFKKSPKIAWALLSIAFLASCSGKDEDAYEDRSLEELYHEGRTFLFQGKYYKAAKTFDEVERQHPYSDWAAQAQLMSAYAYYLDRKYEEALDPIESFIQLHPAHKDIPYAFYLQGLCYYERLAPIERDQDMARLSLDSFKELIKRFPESIYARDAKLKIDLLGDNLAAKEMTAGRYYLNKGAYLAALNRFRTVVETYQTTTQVEEALHRLVEVYLALGLYPEAQKTAAVLGHNFPSSSWYADTYLLLKGEDYRTQAQKEDGNSWLDHLDFFRDRETEEARRKSAHTILTPQGETIPAPHGGPSLPAAE